MLATQWQSVTTSALAVGSCHLVHGGIESKRECGSNPWVHRSIVYGEASTETEDELEGNNRESLQEQSVNVALLSGIPFTSAAVGMVVSC